MSSPTYAPLEAVAKLCKFGFSALNGDKVNENAVFKESLKLAGFGIGYPQQLNVFAYNLLDWLWMGDDLEIADILRFRRN